jgi:hypothetical protein
MAESEVGTWGQIFILDNSGLSHLFFFRIISKLVEGHKASIFQMSSDSRVPERKSYCLQS